MPAFRINDMQLLPGIVNVHLLPGLMLHVHHRVAHLQPFDVIPLELRHTVSIRIQRNVLLPLLLLGVFPVFEGFLHPREKRYCCNVTGIIFNIMARNHVHEELLQLRIAHQFKLLRGLV